MIRRICVVALSVALIGFFAGALFGQSDVIINIQERGTAKIKIGIPAFKQDPESAVVLSRAGNEMTSVLREDLSFSGIFEVFDEVSGMPPMGTNPTGNDRLFAPLNEWIPLDVQGVIQGMYKAVGGDVRFECVLLDVESKTRIVGKSYTGPPRSTRQSAHRFADEVVYRYTGERGIAETSIAYAKAKGDHKEIHIMDYDGHNSYQLTFDKNIALSPDWSPDGGKLVFTSYKDNNPDAYIVDLKAKTYNRISGYIGLNAAPAFSPDGKTLAITLSKSGNPEIYLLDLESRELTRITRNRRADTSPTWSPNGRELAFVSDRSGFPQIYIVDREGVNLRRLTYNGYNNTSPAWSPEGDKIAYVSMTRGRGDIYTIHPTGAALERLTYNGGNEDPSWSPGGRYLAYTSKQSSHKDIYIMRANGAGKKRVTFGGGDNMSPAWSPQ
jgi:TolB protein